MIIALLFVLSYPLAAQPDNVTALPPDSIRELAPGVQYFHSYIPKTRLSVHTVTVDLENANLGVRVGKGRDHIAGLEQVYSIMHRYDSTRTSLRVLAGTNANFWKAGTIHPMGPTVSDGELDFGPIESVERFEPLWITPTPGTDPQSTPTPGTDP